MGRMRSLGVDKNDWNGIRMPRYRNFGACVASEFYQHCPYFLTREGATLELIGQYRGGSAFLIASGPSFNKINKELLKKPGVWAMTLNNAIRNHRGQAACVVDDPARFVKSLWLDPTITKFVPMAIFEKPLWDNEKWGPLNIKVGDCPNVIGYRRNEKFHAQRYLYEDTINWGNHKQWGGGRSVMLAALRILFLLGFRNVYLVGVDFEMSEEKRYHFDEDRTRSAIHGNNSTYSKMKEWFNELQPHFLAENFIVKNTNPDSKLSAFPFIDFEEAIRLATANLGDVENERTFGMYSTYEEKMAELQRQKNNQTNPHSALPQKSGSVKVVHPNPVDTASAPASQKVIFSPDGKPVFPPKSPPAQ